MQSHREITDLVRRVRARWQTLALLQAAVRAALAAAVVVVVALVVSHWAARAPLALALTRLVASQLYNIAPWDPVSILAASVAVVAVALFSAYLPAARATRVNPIYALRHQ